MVEGRTSQERGAAVVPPTVMEIIAGGEREDARCLGWAVAAAVVVHVALFAAHWPSLARAATGQDQPKPRLYVVRQYQFQPPLPEQPQIQLPPVQKIPTPDQDPDGPEPVREEEPRAVFDVPIDDQWIETEVEVPPEPERGLSPDELRIWDSRMTKPVKIHAPSPDYPQVALNAGFGGVVILECVIDRQGAVRVGKVLRGEPLGLTEAAVAAVEQWRFEPSTLGGKPVDVIYVLTVRFTPHRA